MKKLFTLLLIVFGTLLLSTQNVKATHAQGADITYTYTGTPNEYLITLRFYRDCAGINAPPSVDICYEAASIGSTSTITLFPIAGTGIPIPSSSCVTIPTNCAGFGGVGTEEWIYQGVIQLPQAAIDWIFSYQICCRNGVITNLVNPGGLGMYVSAHLNNVSFPTNSSPYFDSVPVTTFCINNQFYYFQGATDIDGDSLHYSLVDAEDATGNCPWVPFALPYVSPYNGLNPLQTANGISIDPLTGVIAFIPNLIQVAVICVKVEDFDTTQFPAVKKGEVRRDLQVLVINNCIVIQPAPSGLGQGGGYNNALFANCQDTSVIIRLSQVVQCGSIAPDGSDFRAIGPNGQPNPVFHAEPVTCTNGQTDSVRVFFYYPLSKVRTALYIKKGSDGNTMLSECGNSIYETNGLDTITINDTINIVVQDTSVIDLNVPNISACIFKSLTVNVLDQILCSTIRSDASDFKLVDATGTQFPLNQAYGSCSGPSPLSPGSFTTTLTVAAANTIIGTSPFYLIAMNGTDNNTISNLCETFYNIGDTIAVIDASAPLLVDMGNDITQCQNDPSPILSTQLSGVPTTWTLNGVLLPDTSYYITAALSGQYISNVSASPSCNGVDTVDVLIILAPSPSILANGVSTNIVTICTGTPYPTLDGTAAGAVGYNWLFNGASVATTPVYTPTQDGTYILQANSVTGGACLGIDTITINTVLSISVDLGADITQCANVAAPVLDAGVFPGAIYLWSTGESTQTIVVTASGTYTVTVTYGVNCSATNDVDVTFDAVPSSPVLADQNICYNAAIGPLNANPFGTQPATATYSWTDATSAVVGTTSLYTPLVAGAYNVSISNNGCTTIDDATVAIEAQVPVNLGAPQTICGAPIVLDAGFAGVVTTYNWTKDGVAFGSTQTVNANGGGNYIVVTSTALGCTSSSAVVITPGTFATSITGNNNICETDSSTFTAVYAGTATVNYNWTYNGAATGTNANTLVATAAGTYAVSITDQYGCKADSSTTLAIENVLAAPVPVCEPQPTGSTPAYLYTWIAIPLAVGYEVSLDGGATWISVPAASTSYGVATPAQTFLVRALGNYCPLGKTSEPAPCAVIVPNVITPNNDGFNDNLVIENLGQYQNVKMSIFNRWGNEIYSNDNYGQAKPFDFNGQPDGTYFYTLSIPNQEAKTGTITLLIKK